MTSPAPALDLEADADDIEPASAIRTVDTNYYQCRDGRWSHPEAPACYRGAASTMTVATVQAAFGYMMNEHRSLVRIAPYDRAAVLSSLTSGQLIALFPDRCSACGKNHRVLPDNMRRAFKAIVQPFVNADDPADHRITNGAVGAARTLSTRLFIGLGAVRGPMTEATAARQRAFAAVARSGGKALRKPGEGEP